MYKIIAIVLLASSFLLTYPDTVKFKNFSASKVWIYIKKKSLLEIDALVKDVTKIVNAGTSYVEDGSNITHIWALPWDDNYNNVDSEKLRNLAEAYDLDQQLGNTTSVLSFDIDNNGKPHLYYGWFDISQPFSYISISDVHISQKEDNKNLTAIQLRNHMITAIKDATKNVCGIIFVGDSAGGYGKESERDAFKAIYFDPLTKIMHNNKGQLFLVPGNHDTYWENWYAPNQPSAMLNFIEKTYGSYAYRFKIGPVLFINLGLYASQNKEQKDNRNVTLLSTSQPSLQSLKQILSKAGTRQPVVIMFHYPIHDSYSDWWHKQEKDGLFETIKDYNILAILVGHSHDNNIFSFRGKCPVIQAADESFAIMRFDQANSTALDIKFVGLDGKEVTKKIISNAAELDFKPAK